MPAGRRPDSPARRRRTGNPGRRPIKPRPRAPADDDIPLPPKHLDARAVEEWTRVAPILVRERRWRPLHGTLLAAYCTAVSRYQDLAERLNHYGPLVTMPPSKHDIEQGRKFGRTVRNPLLSEERAQLAAIVRLADQLGITPGGYARLEPETPASTEDALNEFEAFRARRARTR